MRVEAILLLFLGVFFGIVGVVYWFWSYEDAGTAMLVGTCLLGFLPGSYYFFWHRRMGYRVEDRNDASIEEGAGAVSYTHLDVYKRQARRSSMKRSTSEGGIPTARSNRRSVRSRSLS